MPSGRKSLWFTFFRQGSIANLRGQWKLEQINLDHVGTPFLATPKLKKQPFHWSTVGVTATNPETDRLYKVHLDIFLLHAIVQHYHRAEDGQEQGDCCNTIPWTINACNTSSVWIVELMDFTIWPWETKTCSSHAMSSWVAFMNAPFPSLMVLWTLVPSSWIYININMCIYIYINDPTGCRIQWKRNPQTEEGDGLRMLAPYYHPFSMLLFSNATASTRNTPLLGPSSPSFPTSHPIPSWLRVPSPRVAACSSVIPMPHAASSVLSVQCPNPTDRSTKASRRSQLQPSSTSFGLGPRCEGKKRGRKKVQNTNWRSIKVQLGIGYYTIQLIIIIYTYIHYIHIYQIISS